ncbi:MAG TPA: hypothetical protein PLS90_10805 [Candidatus Sumerlaeota bacterium]|nr:MAG: hypothetical protein BWZ08_01532 [candidate division BRC1 bacterium ADurb.BinA292]HPK02933.1 hypothetical protein [Candidatus Sumerlaeota bacterium]
MLPRSRLVRWLAVNAAFWAFLVWSVWLWRLGLPRGTSLHLIALAWAIPFGVISLLLVRRGLP